MNQKTTQELGTQSIGRLLARLSVPAITAQLVNVLYNMVDRMYIGRMEGVGAAALTGVGVTMPIITLIAAFASLVGMGGAPLASIRLGAGDKEGAESILGNAFTLLIILSLALTAVFTVFCEPLLMMFGASVNTIGYAKDYLGIYVLGTVFVMMTLGLNVFINSQGFAKVGMETVIIGAVLNILLDPLFIFTFHMGVKGAALATILSQAVSCVWVLCFLFGKRTVLRIRRQYMALRARTCGRILSLGLSPFIMQSTESLVQITLNTGLYRYGGDMYVGAMTIINSVMQLCSLPLTGLGQGGQPIISYNYGAGQMDRVRKAFRLLLTTALSISTGMLLLVELFPSLFVRIFNDDPALMEVTVWAMRIFMAGSFAMGAQFAIQQTFLAVGRAKISIFIAMLRKIILLIPLALVMPLLLENKVLGVFIAEPMADILSATTAVLIFTFMSRKLFGRGKKPAPSEASPD